jgi:hypothetical protein
MAFFYSADRQPVEITLSPDDIGVRFAEPDMAASALRAVRSDTGRMGESSARGYGCTLLLHESGASRAAFATVRNTLPRRHTDEVKRTLPVYVEQRSGLRLISTREITVRFTLQASEGAIAQLLLGLNLTIVRRNEFTVHQAIVQSTSDVDETATLDLANRLCEYHELVAYAAPNFIAEHCKAALPKDPRLTSQWHLNNTGDNQAVAGEDVRAFPGWEISPGGNSTIVIAIVDDGVDIGHPDLRDNIWVHPDPSAPDRNGRNFYDQDYNPRPRYFRPPYDQTEGNDIHGTPCAGLAAAASNRRGGVGIAYQCKILPVKIFGADNLAPNDRVADAIRYASLHAQVISCSWSSPINPDLQSAINDVAQDGRGGKGCLVFCAAGNQGLNQVAFPARHPLALGVGASNDQGTRSLYSNFGEGLAFVAPSGDHDRQRPGLTTTDVATRNRGYNLRGLYTDNFSGTSAATPLAAGIAALVLSVKPSLTRAQVSEILAATADEIDTAGGAYQAGYSLQYGYGRLNLHQALQTAQASRTHRQRTR